ncbi:hypothetical protein FS837_002252 [Tulasnella sp. UAMH 9824]|nr:hypothetical protein FS837_002252 [Tulasnella sp. UAMH 9824]
MNRPSKDAITKALNITLESIQGEGNSALSCTHPLNAIPFEQLATEVELLRSAKAHLHKEADERISHIQHRRNLAAPVHRLPQEIFGMILESFAADRHVGEEHGLLQLLHVGRLWYTAITNSPRLWTSVDAALPSKIARLVIDRSKNLPILSLDWNTTDGYDEGEHEKILELAIQNSKRFKSMELRVSSDDPLEVWPLLEAPTPALEVLTVEVDMDLDREKMSSGRLITLSLYRFAIPASINTLLQVLSATQRLEWLALGDKGRIDEPVAPDRQVTLDHLKTLKVDNMTNEYCAALLISIYTPVCSHVDVADSFWSDAADPFDSLIWQPGNTRTAALLAFHPQLDARVLRVAITVESSQVCVRAAREGEGFPRVLSFERPRPGRMVALIGHFFRDVWFCPPIDLTITSGMLQSDTSDLTPWGPRLSRLTLSDPVASLRALEQLALRTPATYTNAGERGTSVIQGEDWMCPNLREITLHIPEIESQFNMRVAALFFLVNNRWSGTDGGPAPDEQPAQFQVQVRCTYPTYKKLQDVEIEVIKVVPFFSFHRKA